MDAVISRSALLLRKQPSNLLLSQKLANRLAITQSRCISASRTLQQPENRSQNRPQTRTRVLDPVERRKAADREQWIKDLNEAIPDWSAPKQAPYKFTKTDEEEAAASFGVAPSKTASQSPLTQSTGTGLETPNLSSEPTKELPTSKVSLYDIRSGAEIFAERVKSIDRNLRLSPRVAYRIPVNASMGSKDAALTRSLQMLDARTSRNKVVLRMRRQKFHERPGLRRKRVKKERWRKHFSMAFKNICARVSRLGRQGW
jgi:small subunit ribosomal protein MRP21